MVCRIPFRCAGWLVSGTHLGGQHSPLCKLAISPGLAGCAAGDHLLGIGVLCSAAAMVVSPKHCTMRTYLLNLESNSNGRTMLNVTLLNSGWLGLRTIFKASGMMAEGTISPRCVDARKNASPMEAAVVELGSASQPSGKSATVRRRYSRSSLGSSMTDSTRSRGRMSDVWTSFSKAEISAVMPA